MMLQPGRSANLHKSIGAPGDTVEWDRRVPNKSISSLRGCYGYWHPNLYIWMLHMSDRTWQCCLVENSVYFLPVNTFLQLAGTGVKLSVGYPLDTDTPGYKTEMLTKVDLPPNTAFPCASDGISSDHSALLLDTLETGERCPLFHTLHFWEGVLHRNMIQIYQAESSEVSCQF